VTVRIANAAGFLGDRPDAPRRLLERADVDYLTLEYLAELTMSILARQREKDPAAGFAGDFLDVLRDIAPLLVDRPGLCVVTNAGGMNVESCAKEASRILAAAGLGELPIGAVWGDDLLPKIGALTASGCDLAHMDTGQPLAELGEPVACANAYLGGEPIARALADGARVVITGRVADASLTVGPAVHALGWNWSEYDRLAAASVAGHLIECGAQVTGGYTTDWRRYDLADVGYPIAEIEPGGDTVITKPDGSGGAVTRHTVAEQLVYEIGDPRCYKTPDVDVDFTSVSVREVGTDRVAVSGARGTAPSGFYKVSLAYRSGFTAAAQLLVYGTDAVDKAKAAAAIVQERLRRTDLKPEKWNVELLGNGDGVPGIGRPAFDVDNHPREIVLRLSAWDRRREVLERFTREIAPLITSGPAGLAGYAVGRSPVREVMAYWPALVPRDAVKPLVAVRTCSQWLADTS
jgi:hypothetical protein